MTTNRRSAGIIRSAAIPIADKRPLLRAIALLNTAVLTLSAFLHAANSFTSMQHMNFAGTQIESFHTTPRLLVPAICDR